MRLKKASTEETAVIAPESGKKRWWSEKKHKKWIIWIVVILAVILTAVFFLRRLGQKTVSTVSYTEAPVEQRTITNSLSGSGTLQPADSYNVTTLVSGEILSDHFSEGDVVTKDQLLYSIDASDASSSQTQAQNSYNQAVKSKYPTADLSGTVSEVYVRNGDTVSNGAQLCKIVGDNNISMDFSFTYANTSDFYVGQKATIFINGFAGSVSGTVQQVSKSSSVLSTGVETVSVRVTAANPGLVTTDYTAQAVIGSYTSYGWASVKIASSSIITASASGKVAGMTLIAGDTISNGTRICTITGDSIDNTIENAQLSLNNAQNKLDDYEVTSPIAGTVIEKYVKAGDNVSAGSGSTALCIIYDLSYLEMKLNIDELDISSVSVGQSVSITADAVEGVSYEGVVTKISVVGSTTSGTTTYPVTIRLDKTDGLLPGMNVDAEIVLSEADNALAIPNGAVNRGNTVLITADSPSAVNATEDAAPEGYVYVQVTTGVSDDSYIEILSGLQEGDTVAYLRTGSSDGMYTMMAMGGEMSGAAMPSGGGPGGGPGGGSGGGFPG